MRLTAAALLGLCLLLPLAGARGLTPAALRVLPAGPRRDAVLLSMPALARQGAVDAARQALALDQPVLTGPSLGGLDQPLYLLAVESVRCVRLRSLGRRALGLTAPPRRHAWSGPR